MTASRESGGRPAASPAKSSLGDLRLLHEITVIANEAPSAEWALERAIERICLGANWPVGHVYLETPPGSGEYRDQGIWWLDSPDRYQPLATASREKVFTRGLGSVGRVIASGRAERITDVRQETDLVRRRELEACGIRSGVAFPILVGRRVAGVLEFFSARRRRLDAAHLETLSQLGTHLGRTIERKELEREIATRAAREQMLIGREIHDTLGQQVTAIEMLIKGLARRLSGKTDHAEAVARIVGLVEEAKRQVRALSRGLTPVEVDAGGLMAALENLAEDTAAVHGLECRFDCPRPVEIRDAFAAEQLYRITREAVHNAVKHAEPSRIAIGLAERGGLIRLRVENDGKTPEPRSLDGDGQGLRIMSHRARSIGASLRIEVRDPEGVRLSCTYRNRQVQAPAGAEGRAGSRGEIQGGRP